MTSVVNAIMKSPDWPSTAIFISWDDWGGFYDHVVPPNGGRQRYGLRVPGLMISPYAKKRLHRPPDPELRRLPEVHRGRLPGWARLDPATDGRPDPRTTVREDAPILGDLTKEFDFTQPPRPPLILKPRPNGVDPQAKLWNKWLVAGGPPN